MNRMVGEISILKVVGTKVQLKRGCAFFVLLIGFATLVQANKPAFSDSTQNLLLLTDTGLATLDTEKGTLVYLPNQVSPSQAPVGSTSPSADNLIYWYPDQIVTQGFWSIAADSGPTKLSIPFSTNSVNNSDYDFADARWPLGKRYILIEAGKHIPSPNVIGGIREVSSRWLIDRVANVIIPWYWNCNQIIRINSPGNMFVSKCILDETYTGQAVQVRYLTPNGIIDQITELYSVIDGPNEQSAFDPNWWLSDNLKSLAFVDFSNGIINQKIKYLFVTEKSVRDVEDTKEFVLQLSWSPSGKYLVNFNQCSKLFTCVEIRNILTNAIVWNSVSLNLNDVVYADNIVWLSDETGFFLLGHEAGEPYVWRINLNASLPVNQWSLPPDTYHMISYEITPTAYPIVGVR